MANVLWKLVLANTKSQLEGSVGSAVQVNVILPPDVGLVEVTAKPDMAEATGRRKRRLNGNSEKDKRMCKAG
jgi:hypothetical protein